MHLTQTILVGKRILFRELVDLVSNPVFLFVSLVGNGIVFLGGSLFFMIEKGSNEHIHSWFDGIYWAFATVTTVGYGDIAATTIAGKLVSIVLMVVGTGLFWTYAALFSSALVRNQHALNTASDPASPPAR